MRIFCKDCHTFIGHTAPLADMSERHTGKCEDELLCVTQQDVNEQQAIAGEEAKWEGKRGY